ncbi:PASTA domain-containing protein [Dactylosporangium sp. NPDC049140]|uniref:PASTA domain-containing protein n=1 Tax=Dactylosporangium sp. NPDC049140 TaxID=3155647 RepID=UPI0033F73100
MKKLIAAAFGAALVFVATPALAAPAPPDLRVKVPNVVGLNDRDAVKILKTAGLGVAADTAVDCANIDVVLAQDPAGGRIVPLGTRVLITIGAAPEKGCP